MISTRTIIFLSYFILSVFFQSVFSSNDRTIKVKDAVNSKLYQGPKNPRRSGLSSYILRSEKSSTQKTPQKYFTGSPKPVWDDPPGIAKLELKYFYLRF